MNITIEELRTLRNQTTEALSASTYVQAASENITDMRGFVAPRRTSGWKVIADFNFIWLQVRNYDKNGREISAKKYLPTLEAAGLKVKLDGNRIKIITTN